MTLNVTDHELMRLIRKRVNQKPSIPMTQIAAELGMHVDDLCAFIMAYKEPKREPYLTPRDPALPPHPRHHSTDAQRFLNWKRQHDGAREARRSQ